MNESQEISSASTKTTRRKFLRNTVLTAVSTAVGVIPDKAQPRIPLDNWVNERGLLHLRELNGRLLIANALKEDSLRLKTQGRLNSTETSEVVKSIAGKSMESVKKAIDEGMDLKKERQDSITKEPYTVEVVLGNDAYVARETRPDGSIISEAKLNTNGSTELTLQFKGARYQNANPDITRSNNFPKASATTFNLLTNSVLGK